MDVTNAGLIERAARKCLRGKWRRGSVHLLLSRFCDLKPPDIAQAVKDNQRQLLDPALHNLAEWLADSYRRRVLQLPPVHQFSARDRSSGKVRDYCEESILQQICNYVAVEALMPLFNAKIGAHQCASLVGRGQRYGQKLIRGWMRTDPDGTRDCIQADVRKTYPSTHIPTLKAKLKRDVKNDALLWLVFTLLDTMPRGLSIGSYLSMFLCNYLMSYAWRACSTETRYTEWAKDPKTGVYRRASRPSVSHRMLYMDDLLLYGRNKRRLLRAFLVICRYFRTQLRYHIKRAWRHYRTHYKDRSGRSRGAFTDIMGVRFYRDHTTLRRRIFLRTRKVYAKLDRRTRAFRPIPKRLAGRAVSYNGWLMHSDSRRWMRQHVYKHGLAKRARSTIAYYAKKGLIPHDPNHGKPVPV